MTTHAEAASALLVSIGNSRSATARSGPSGALSDVRRFPTASLDLTALDPGPEPVHVIAVVEDVARQLTAALRRTGRDVTWWGVDREIPVRHPYTPPEAPGADRLVAALAAFDRAGGPCVVVDAGTAVTVDVVGADGAFLGGAIAPGLMALREGLRARAPALPPPASDPPPYPGRSSAAAVGHGIAAAFSGALRALVEQALGVAGDVPVLVTGGDCVPAAAALESFRPRIVPELVLEGLARLAATT